MENRANHKPLSIDHAIATGLVIMLQYVVKQALYVLPRGVLR